VEEKFVRFFGGGFAVVAGDGEVDVVGDQSAFEGVDFGGDGMGDIDGVGGFPLGDSDGDGGFEGVAGGEMDVLGGFLAAVSDLGDIAEIDGFAAGCGDDDALGVLGVAEE
jgi:hypothetical protein